MLAISLQLGIAGCGDDESQDGDVEARIAAERADAAQQARQRAQIKELEDELKSIKEEGDSTVTAPATEVPASSPVAPATFTPFTTLNGGWAADVPTGGGWSEAVETQLNPGLHRTTFTGPSGAVLIVDSTPSETPTYSGDIARTPIGHPIFSGVEQLVFRGNTTVSPCETSYCVDYLIPSGEGGYAVLAGGPGSFAALQSIAESVMLSLTPYDI